MKSRNVFFGLVFFAFGAYQYTQGQPLETVLYSLLGCSFIVTYLSYREGLNPSVKKALTVSSWIFIILAGMMFLYLLRIEAWSWG